MYLMSAITIMQLAARICKGQRVTIPALSGAEFRLFLDSISVIRGVMS